MMMKHPFRNALSAALLAGTALLSPPTAQAEPVEIKEWSVPWQDGRSRDPYAFSTEMVWFVDQVNGYLVKLDTTDGTFTKKVLKDGSGPHNLIVDETGVVWYAGNRTALIGKYDPKTDTITEYPMPDDIARDPHTMVFDGQGHIWFTAQGGNSIGRLTMTSGEVDLIAVPTERARPYGIKMAPDGTVWAALFGTYKLGRIDPESLELTEIDLPREGARPRRLEITADGRVWYGDYAEGKLGVYDPVAEAFEEWDLPGGVNAQPYATVADAKGRVWLFETGMEPNRLVGFDPETEDFFSVTPIPSGGGVVRHTHFHAAEGAVWFGTDFHTIGRADLSK